MTEQIDELMALHDECVAAEMNSLIAPGHVASRKREELRQALEAALKPVDDLDAAFREGVLHAAKKYAAVREQRFTGGDVALYLEMEAAEVDTGYTAAPPAQTKRLDSDESRLTPNGLFVDLIAQHPGLADEYADAEIDDIRTGEGKSQAKYEALKQALEAALKPGEPDRYVWEEHQLWADGWGWHERENDTDPRTPENKQYYPNTDFNDPDHVRNFRALYTSAPPAQTPPPRLTDEQISDIAISTPPNVHIYGRAIESAVRAQFGAQE